MGLKRTGYAENNIQLISITAKISGAKWSGWKNYKKPKDSTSWLQFSTANKAKANWKKKKNYSSRAKSIKGGASQVKGNDEQSQLYKTRSQTWYDKPQKVYKKKNGKKKFLFYGIKKHYVAIGQYKYIKTGANINLIDDDMQPSEMKVTFSDIDVKDGNAGTDVGRNKRGYITRNKVRSSVRTVEVTWNYLTQKQIKSLMSIARMEFVYVTYTDPTGDTRTITAYPSDTTFEASNLGHWTNISMSFVEV